MIDAALADQLGDFLRFRNVFRNVYGSLLQAERMRPLEERVPGVLAAFRRHIRAFIEWMVGASAHRWRPRVPDRPPTGARLYTAPAPRTAGTSTAAGSGVKSSPGLMKRLRSRPYCLS